jgi:hypothetical protein
VLVISLIGQMGEGAMNEAVEENAEENNGSEANKPANGPLSIEQVLVEEADSISGGTSWLDDGLRSKLSNQKDHAERTKLNADDRDRSTIDETEVERRKSFYRSLNKLNRGAVCCSGGGIRSATFCLGVAQALAGYDVQAKQTVLKTQKIEHKNSLLGYLEYLSTVSGGGYFGSWLSAWRKREGFQAVVANLTGRPRGPDVEPPQLSWLRAYSNYLTPQLGITSADSWAAVAILVRNLVLNWLIIIPIVCLAILLLKIIATVSVWIAHGQQHDSCVIGVLLGGIFFLIVAQAFTTRHRPPRRPQPPNPHGRQTQAAAGGKRAEELPGNVGQRFFLLGDFIWAVFSAIMVTVFFVSSYFWRSEIAGPSALRDWLEKHCPGLWQGLTAIWSSLPSLTANGVPKPVGIILVTAGVSVVIYAIGWIVGAISGWISDTYSGRAAGFQKSQRGFVDFIFWALSGLIYGGLVGLGAILFTLLKPYDPVPPFNPSDSLGHLMLPMIFGVPWVLMAQLTADNVFGGLVSYEPFSDADREWLGRAAGWLAAMAVVWALTALLVFAGDYLVQYLAAAGHKVVVAAGGVFAVLSGIVTALLGSSSATPANSSRAKEGGVKALASAIVMAVAGPIFAAALVVALSLGLDKLLLESALVKSLQGFTDAQSIGNILKPLLAGAGVTFAIGLIASYCVNINRFSLHALYRNRLTRAYLGASRSLRSPDLFTGFDSGDNIRMHELWPPDHNPRCLFHVVNIALNIVSTKRLAWQERKAEAFTVSPLHCGSANLGYRRSEEYGDGPKDKQAEDDFKAGKREFGIALGTAMAISGAAVSPNMGYNSSPSITLLLALFNARLGWWLGNPGENGNNSYKKEGPRMAAGPLLAETLGLTTDERPYVYLSDGGHFEDLGLYEMVRRRCRFIVLIDAGEDGDFAFEDLGNAVRKIYIDLGIRITLEGLERLQNHPSPHPLSGAVLDAAARVNVEVAKVAKAVARAAHAVAKGGEAEAKADETAEPGEIPYYALGTIHYVDADGKDADVKRYGNGTIIYIKPAYHGTEDSAGIRSYAMAHPDFPHETTVDQWFTESQFESYRSLGFYIANQVINDIAVQGALRDYLAPKL